MAKKTSTPIDFEATMKELELLVGRMEKGDLPLEESLKQYERGMELTQACQKALNDAELTVTTISERYAKDSGSSDQ